MRSDVYEGTRDAKVEDLAGIRHIIKPLEESGILVRRTDEEVIALLSSTSYCFTGLKH